MKYFKVFLSDGGYVIEKGYNMRQTACGGLEIIGLSLDDKPIAVFNPHFYSYAKEIKWQEEAKALMKSSKVQAIKFCRDVTGMSLKDANEACMAL